MNLLSHCLGSMEGTPLSQRGSCNTVPMRCVCHDADKSRSIVVALLTEPRQALTCPCSECLPRECDQQEHLQDTKNVFVRLL